MCEYRAPVVKHVSISVLAQTLRDYSPTDISSCGVRKITACRVPLSDVVRIRRMVNGVQGIQLTIGDRDVDGYARIEVCGHDDRRN